MNTGMKRSLAPDHVQPLDGKPPHMQIEDFGRPPILCEVIEAEIAIKTTRRNLSCWAVNAEGFYIGKVPVSYEDGFAKIAIGKQYPSIYYLIQAE